MVPNALIVELQSLREQFPQVDFDNEYHLLDEASWSGYEDGHAAYLIHHIPTDSLHLLEDVHCCMGQYEPPVWTDLHPITWDKWFELKTDLEEAEGASF